MRTHRIVTVALVTLALAGCAASEAYICYAAPWISAPSTAQPGTTITVTGAEFIVDRRDHVRYDAFGCEAVVDGARFEVGTVTPDAEGSWTVDWRVPEGAFGSATVEANDGRWIISLDTSGAQLVDG